MLLFHLSNIHSELQTSGYEGHSICHLLCLGIYTVNLLATKEKNKRVKRNMILNSELRNIVSKVYVHSS